MQASGSKEHDPTSKLPQHPDNVNEHTKQYVESVVSFLKQQNGQYSMSRLGVEVKRPEGALKFGKILQKYESWFRRSGQKGSFLQGIAMPLPCYQLS
jgi:thiaminase